MGCRHSASGGCPFYVVSLVSLTDALRLLVASVLWLPVRAVASLVSALAPPGTYGSASTSTPSPIPHPRSSVLQLATGYPRDLPRPQVPDRKKCGLCCATGSVAFVSVMHACQWWRALPRLPGVDWLRTGAGEGRAD